MKTKVGTFEAKTHLSRLLDQVEEGAVVYITRHGKTVARLMPPELEEKQKAEFGCAKAKPGEFYMAPDFDEALEEFKAYIS